jgi:putative colanic acid biosynthesis acetyltransferase WcaF
MELRGYTTGSFQRGSPRWKEAAWYLVKCLFFESPWPWPSAVRVALLRAFGARVGQDVTIRSKVNVTFPWRLTIGDHVWIGEEVVLLSLAPITIGSHVCISQRAFLCTGSHAFESPKFDLIVKPIEVCSRSWLAASVFVAPGVTIGPDSMVRAGSVVLQAIPPRTIAGGNPAEVIRSVAVAQP